MLTPTNISRDQFSPNVTPFWLDSTKFVFYFADFHCIEIELLLLIHNLPYYISKKIGKTFESFFCR